MTPLSILSKPILSKLQSLSDEELKVIEKNERRNIEVQINRLKNIQVLLDTAVMEMGQYSAVVSQLDLTKSRNQTNSTDATSTVLGNNKYVNAEPTMVKSSLNRSDEKTTFGHPKSPLLPNRVTGNWTKIKSLQDIGDKKTEDNVNEVRKRRIEKFGSTQK